MLLQSRPLADGHATLEFCFDLIVVLTVEIVCWLCFLTLTSVFEQEMKRKRTAEALNDTVAPIAPPTMGPAVSLVTGAPLKAAAAPLLLELSFEGLLVRACLPQSSCVGPGLWAHVLPPVVLLPKEWASENDTDETGSADAAAHPFIAAERYLIVFRSGDQCRDTESARPQPESSAMAGILACTHPSARRQWQL